MQTLTITLKTVTPLFLGGADQDKPAELRPPSIKGALRFWYRAIDLDYIKSDEPSKLEDKIFGSTEYGQSTFSIQVSACSLIPEGKGDDRWNDNQIAYLGYGPINRDYTGFILPNGKKEQKSMTTRPYLKSGSTFELSIHFKPKTSDDSRSKVERALWAFLTLGGVGSRSRRGFGSLMVTKIEGEKPGLPPWQFKSCDELINAIQTFFKDKTFPGGLPRYTCFSQDSRCVVVHREQNGEEILKLLGEEMQEFRSYRKPEGKDRFYNDHDIMQQYIQSGKVPPNPPERTAFGLPHNYFFSSTRTSGNVDFIVDGKPGRRASPVMFHIQGLTNGSACVVATYLPAELIPENAQIQLSTKGQDNKPINLPNKFSAITDFMNLLASYGTEVQL